MRIFTIRYPYMSNRRSIHYPIGSLCIIVFQLLMGVGVCYGQALDVTWESSSACAAPSISVITATGGTGPYTYIMDGGAPQASNIFPGLAIGAHVLEVDDAAGNVWRSDVLPHKTFAIDCITGLTVNTTPATCSNSNGQIKVFVQGGGNPPFLYSVDGVTYQASNTFDVPGGPYQVWVKDDSWTTQTTTGMLMVGGLTGATVQPTATGTDCSNNTGQVTVGTFLGAAPFGYSLDNPNGPFVSSNVFNGVSSGTHIAYVHDQNDCITQATIPVPLNNTLVLTMGPDQTICEGKNVALVAASPNAVTYAWTPATGLSNTTVVSPVASPTTTTTYSLLAMWGPCTRTGQEKVIVNPAPIANAGPSDTTCYGVSVQLAGEGTGGTGPYSYKWTPDKFLDNPNEAGPFAITPTSSVVYGLQVTDALGCTSLNTSKAIVTVTPPPVIFAGNDTNVVAGVPVPLHSVDVLPSGFTIYSWTPAEGLTTPNAPTTVWTAATQTTTFVVTGKTANGCPATDSITVKVFDHADIYVPTAFSPNHDGHNDVLRVVAPSIAILKVFAVYDRWGAKVFETANAGIGWDGTRDGHDLPPGAYVWMAVGVDYKGSLVQRKGTVVLVR